MCDLYDQLFQCSVMQMMPVLELLRDLRTIKIDVMAQTKYRVVVIFYTECSIRVLR